MSLGSLPIVVIHGVGTPEPGSEIQQLARGILGADAQAATQAVEVDGFCVPTAIVTSHGARAKLYEVNWADVAKPRHGLIGTILFFVRVQLAMIQLAQSGWSSDRRGPAGPSLIGRLFRYATIGGSLWVVAAPTAVLLALVVTQVWLAALLLAAVFLLGVIVAHVLGLDDRLALLGYLWSTAAVALGAALLILDLPEKTIVKYTAESAGAVETLSGTLVLLGMIEALIRYWRTRDEPSSGSQALVRCALFVLPFSLLIGGVGALLVACDLWLTQSLSMLGAVDESRLDSVLNMFSSEATYNIAFMEVVNGTSTFLLLFSIAAAVLLWQAALGTGLVSKLKWGNAFRGMITAWLVLLIVLTLVVVTAFYMDLSGAFPFIERFDLNTIPLVALIVTALSPAEATGNILEVYKYSALRLTPAVLWAFPRLRSGLDIVADVLFYLLPPWSPMSTAQITRSRLARCIALARSETGSEPVVLAYSQGSRIAVDLLSEMPDAPKRLVTIGCPVGVLHGSFLGLPAGILDSRTPRIKWTNLYRNSDFIGGPVPTAASENQVVDSNFRSSHYNYYTEPDVVRVLLGKQELDSAALAHG